MLTERELINQIRGQTEKAGRDMVMGIGDDCAVLRRDAKNLWLVTTDTLVESVHFDLSWHPPDLLGRKSVAVNISDIAAMGGRPFFALLSLALPQSFSSIWIDDFMKGIISSLKNHDTILIGGDTVKSPDKAVITVTVIGEVEEKQCLYRSGARPDDLIWVSGPLGEAAAGLELCRRGFLDEDELTESQSQLIQAHLDPSAQVLFGRILAESGLVHAMMDISDGVATDLAHMCDESEVGAEVSADKIPVSEALQEAAESMKFSELDLALMGGEDYQLLFTTSPLDGDTLRNLVLEETGRKIHNIGRITAGKGVFLQSVADSENVRKEIGYSGYDHFGTEE